MKNRSGKKSEKTSPHLEPNHILGLNESYSDKLEEEKVLSEKMSKKSVSSNNSFDLLNNDI